MASLSSRARLGGALGALGGAFGAIGALGARGALGALCVLLLAGPSGAGELVMFERNGCAWCQRFDVEVSPIYDRTDEGRQAPLRRANMSAGVPPDLALAAPVRFAPTFVLVEEGREVGRITGYMSDNAFWGMLGTLVQKPAQSQ
ncbi:thioredoxin fold domain-containing protein [Roseixanthobacter liquoris]|uniref:thioredoxin fold domain-containing protein n=1 Tax=Roseixanthobacter liquoris TaxID=3119921 RepID=UPI0037285C68